MDGVKRRAVVRGAAWSVPVVLATASAPAYAASVTVNGTITAACGTRGSTKVYTFTVDFCNNTSSPVTITITSIVIAGTSLTNLKLCTAPTTGCATAPASYTLAANQCPVTLYVVGENGSALTGAATITYTADPGGTYTATKPDVPAC